MIKNKFEFIYFTSFLQKVAAKIVLATSCISSMDALTPVCVICVAPPVLNSRTGTEFSNPTSLIIDLRHLSFFFSFSQTHDSWPVALPNFSIFLWLS